MDEIDFIRKYYSRFNQFSDLFRELDDKFLAMLIIIKRIIN